MSIPIGIDFGTSKTLVTCINPDSGHPLPIRLGRGRDEIPTTVFLCEDGSLLFGDDADDNAQFDFSSYARGFKLSLGSRTPLLIGAGKSYSASQLTRAFLHHIKERCEKEGLMEPITSAVITVPAIFSPAQRDELLQAAKGAGFSSVELLPEPIAAGMAFCGLSPKDAFEGSILVVDWGGGTLDLAVVSRAKNGRFETVEGLVDGSSGIGGEAMDEAMWKLVAELLAEDGDVDLAGEPVERRGVQLTAIRQAKEMLSARDEHRVTLLTSRGPKGIVVSRNRLNSVIMSHVEQGAAKAHTLIHAARQQGYNPLFVLLVGGTCRIPLVHRAIESSTRTECRLWQYSREAVAFGAAIAASQAASTGATTASPKSTAAQAASVSNQIENNNFLFWAPGYAEPIMVENGRFIDYLHIEGAMFCRADDTEWISAGKIGTVFGAKAPPAPDPAAAQSAASTPACCKVYVQPAALGRIIGAAEMRESLQDYRQLSAFIDEHRVDCFVDLIVENRSSVPLLSPRLTLITKEAANPQFRQMQDIPAKEKGVYNSLDLDWVITPGDEVHVEFANMPGVRAELRVTPDDCVATWFENKKALQPTPVFVTWRRGLFKGAVLCVKNLSDRSLRGVTLSTSAGETTNKHDIGPNEVLEIGSLELTGDRNFERGDTFNISAPGFLDVAGFVMDEEGNCEEERGWVKVAKVAAAIGLGAAGISLGG